ncbi:MAG: MFS transporter [Kofleriaceae bacterium]
MPVVRLFAVFRTPRMAVLFALGWSSGIPLYLTGLTLQAWLTELGVSLDRIAAVPLMGLAYTLKFLWAPVLDRFQLPLLGRRRGWMLTLQVLLVVAIAALGMCDPIGAPNTLVAMAMIVALLSASFDVVLDAYNADLLAPHERAAGSAAYVLGYRTAMVTTGALALVLADHLTWPAIYGVMAALMVIGIVATLLAEEPAPGGRRLASFGEALYRPFVELWHRLGPRTLALVLAFTAVYKFGDHFAQVLVITFLKRGAGFEYTEIAAIYQVLGLAGTALGGMTAGILVSRFGLPRMLVAFGVLQSVTNLLYAALAAAASGDALWLFSTAVLVDNLANAMGTAAFLALLMSVCSPAVSATQLALLTSLSSVGQRVFGPFAASVVEAADWTGFFAITSALAIPGIVLAAVVSRQKFAHSPASS